MEEILQAGEIKSYLTIIIKPSGVSYILIHKGKITEKNDFNENEVKLLPQHINHLSKVPVHIVFSSWDLKIKTLNLHNINAINSLYLRRSFLKGEFDNKDFIKSQRSTADKNQHHFVGIPYNYILDQALITLLNIKNPVIKISCEEELYIDYLHNNSEHLKQNWSLSFFEEKKKWKIIVANKNDIILQRNGVLPKGINNISRYYVQEILDTVRFLPKFGFRKNNEICLFYDIKSFRKDDFEKRGIILSPYTNIEHEQLYYPKTTSLRKHIKNWLKLDFSNANININYFFWHRILYSFPKYMLQLLVPLILFVLLGCFIYGSKFLYYQSHNKQIRQKIENITKIQNAENESFNEEHFQFFKKNYQQNPIINIRAISESVQSMLSAHRVDWERNKNILTIKLLIDKKNLKGKKNLRYVQKKIEHFIEKKIPSSQTKWLDQKNNNLLINITIKG